MRKSIALLLVLLISLSLCPALAGCGATGGSPAAVIGTWEGEWDYNGAHIKCTLTVKDDGTYERTHVRDNIPSGTEKGDYEFADNILTTYKDEEHSVMIRYELVAGQLANGGHVLKKR